MSGWIKLHRSLLEWEWYGNKNARLLLIHLLVSVNHEDKNWHGVTIKAGSMAFSWETLSKGVGLTVKECRAAMTKLEKNGKEVVRERAGNFQLVTLVKWDKLQGIEKTRAGKGQVNGQLVGSERATTKEREEDKEDKNERKEEKKEGVVFPFNSSEFLSLWENWKIYKKKEFRFSYKSTQSEQAALMKVQKLSAGDEKKAIEIIMQSMSNGWQGFFNIKEENGQSKNTGLHGDDLTDYINRKSAKVFGNQNS